MVLTDSVVIADIGESLSTELKPDSRGSKSIALLVISAAKWLPRILYSLITFATISLPTWLYRVFSMTLTFSLNATTLMLIVLAFVSTISWFIRYRFLNMYTRLPPEPQRKEPQIELFPDTHDGGYAKPGLASYLDEFLSAIKVFGYLERPVFHELTRTMQTRKLIAGETLLLEEEKGFCLVVDGLVQIFVKSDRNIKTADKPSWLQDRKEMKVIDDDDDRPEGHQGYQLLTEVQNGAPMSSLFSILSLFTEDVKLKHDDEDDEDDDDISYHSPTKRLQPETNSTSSFTSPQAGGKTNAVYESDLHLRRLSSVPPMALDQSPLSPDGHSRPFPIAGVSSKGKSRASVHPNIVARATIDTTIAIIPASAFKRLTRVYPRATAHIVQVILSRLQRVTLATAHSYLGLTTEVLDIEKYMNKYSSHDLPNHLRGNALERLKTKFQREMERLDSTEEGMKGIALHNPSAGRRRRLSSNLRKDMVAQLKLATGHSSAGSTSRGNKVAAHVTPQWHNVSPGDLLANIQDSRLGPRKSGFPINNNPGSQLIEARELKSPLAQFERSPFTTQTRYKLHRQESLDEDDVFRDSIALVMTKAIGLGENSNHVARAESVEQSPRLVSYDRRRQTATFTNAFGFIDPYEGSGDGDNDSVASNSAASTTGNIVSGHLLSQELKNELEIVYFPKGAVLVEQGERNPGLYYVIDGFLDVSYSIEEKSVFSEKEKTGPTFADFSFPELNVKGSSHSNTHHAFPQPTRKTEQSLFMIKPGGLAGYVGGISSYRSFVDIRAKTDVYVGFLPRVSLENIVEKYPIVLLTMAKRLTSLLPKLILHIDFALEWVQVNAGDVIHHQGDESDAIYIVLNGRLRSILEKGKGDMRVVGEYGQGESVGELEVMTESARPATLHAIRDTEVAKFPKSLFNSLALEHPGITMKISKIIAQRMRTLIEDPLFEQGKDVKTTAAGKAVTSTTVNLRTIAVLPVAMGVPVIDFSSRLLNALSQIGVINGVTSLNHAAILNHLGRHAFSKMGKLKLAQYLADLEERYGMVLYVADTNVNSPWTQTCVRQADCILLVGLAEASPAMGEFERFLLSMKTTARKELVLLHAERYSPSGLTRRWTSNRMWVNGGHHHIQMAFSTQTEPTHHQIKRLGHALKQRVQVLQAEIQKYTSRRIRQTPLYYNETPFKGDFHRLARRLCGKSVGLVLGGGGARGIAHIGIIRALEEAGIPIDIVGGTSIGAFIGALYARDADHVPMYGRAKKFAGRMGSMWRFALDLTYPSISYTTGHEFNRGIFKTFGNSQIEDFWLEFYCNTTNISKSRSEIHNSGYVWRYVRASMSLAGLLPPLCDEGSMLVDGGYVDNLTVSHMKSLGADVVFAIDVGSLDDDTPQSFGDSLSGIWALINRWNPFSSFPNPPTLSEIQARLAYVSSNDALERAKSTPGCLYMRPPIDHYGTLDFAKFDEIYEVGYKYGVEFLANLRDKGVLPALHGTEEKKKLMRTMAPRRASI